MTMGMGTWATRAIATALVATDGTGDFTDIQEAINSLPEIDWLAPIPTGGGVVYIKEGIYQITESIVLRDGVALMGAGWSTHIYTEENIPLIYGNENGDITIKDLRLSGVWPGLANSAGIYFYDVTDVFIANCWITYVTTGIHLEYNCRNCLIIGNRIPSVDTGILIDAIPPTSNCYTNLISSNILTSSLQDGIEAIGLRNSVISSNIITQCNGRGLSLDTSSQCTIIGNTLRRNSGGNLVADTCTNCTLSANGCYGEGAGGANSWGINLTDCDYNTISGNIASEHIKDGILLTTSDDNVITGNNCYYNRSGNSGIVLSTSDRNLISSNVCRTNNGYGIDLDANSDSNVITSNIATANVTGQIRDLGGSNEVAHNKTA